MRRSESFRETVQPLVRSAAMRGATIADVAQLLRATYGHAYRRADMLADMRRYRDAAQSFAIAGYRDLRRLIARAGVAAFSLALFLPTLVSSAAPPHDDVLVADIAIARDAAIVLADERVPTLRERAVARDLLPTPQPSPSAAPTPTPTAKPTLPPPAAHRGGPAVRVIASWYGPGFFENRLPCWPWLQANGQPIQFLPDTWGVAHKSLPCGTTLRLTHGTNTITVPVVDRGPYIAGRELDLSPRVKAALGCPDLCSLLMQIP